MPRKARGSWYFHYTFHQRHKSSPEAVLRAGAQPTFGEHNARTHELFLIGLYKPIFNISTANINLQKGYKLGNH